MENVWRNLNNMRKRSGRIIIHLAGILNKIEEREWRDWNNKNNNREKGSYQVKGPKLKTKANTTLGLSWWNFRTPTIKRLSWNTWERQKLYQYRSRIRLTLNFFSANRVSRKQKNSIIPILEAILNLEPCPSQNLTQRKAQGKYLGSTYWSSVRKVSLKNSFKVSIWLSLCFI